MHSPKYYSPFKRRSMKRGFTGILCLTMATCFIACDKDDDHHDNDLSKMDRNFIIQASYANNSEVAAGATATVKGRDTAVKSFGGFMVTEHTTAQSELKALADKWKIETPTTPDSAHIAMMKKMEALQGYSFDTAYMKSQVKDHIAAMDLFQQEATNGENRQLRDYANKYLPHIRMHKQHADSILAKLH
jgi:putative membrane protein